MCWDPVWDAMVGILHRIAPSDSMFKDDEIGGRVWRLANQHRLQKAKARLMGNNKSQLLRQVFHTHTHGWGVLLIISMKVQTNIYEIRVGCWPV